MRACLEESESARPSSLAATWQHAWGSDAQRGRGRALAHAWGLSTAARLCACPQNNQLSGALPAAFAGLGQLQVLRLGFNRFAGPLPEAWARLAELRVLDLRQNSLTGALPAVRRTRSSCGSTLPVKTGCQASTC